MRCEARDETAVRTGLEKKPSNLYAVSTPHVVMQLTSIQFSDRIEDEAVETSFTRR